MERSIQELAKLAGTTSRTLRHYDEIGLLKPSSIGANGYRYYDDRSLVRLQRILLLRELGLGLPQIAEVLDRQTSEQRALEAHLAWLRQEQERLQKQIASVTSTMHCKEVLKSWLKRCSMGSITPNTKMRSSNAGARMPTRKAMRGGAA
jgi:MerR family transcriptional regulator, thiopeptide resistance regulator